MSYLPSLPRRSIAVALALVAAALVVAGSGGAVPDSPTGDDTSLGDEPENDSAAAEVDGEPATGIATPAPPADADIDATADAEATNDSDGANASADASANASAATDVDAATGTDTIGTGSTTAEPGDANGGSLDTNAPDGEESPVDPTPTDASADASADADRVAVAVGGNASVSGTTDGIEAALSTGAAAAIDRTALEAEVSVTADDSGRFRVSEPLLDDSGADLPPGVPSTAGDGEATACRPEGAAGAADCRGPSAVPKESVAGDGTSRAAGALGGDRSGGTPERGLESTVASGTEAIGGAAALTALGWSVTATASAALVAVALSASTTLSGSTLTPVVRGWGAGRGRLPRWGPVAGYSRYDDSDPLENDVRHGIYRTVEASPGVYRAQVADAMDVAAPTVQYHARILEEEGLIHSRKTDGRHRLYPMDCDDPELSAALTDEARASLLHALAHREPATLSELASELDRASSTVSYHLSRLEEDGLVDRQRDGRTVLTRLAPTVRDSLAAADADAEAGTPLPTEASP